MFNRFGRVVANEHGREKEDHLLDFATYAAIWGFAMFWVLPCSTRRLELHLKGIMSECRSCTGTRPSPRLICPARVILRLSLRQ